MEQLDDVYAGFDRMVKSPQDGAGVLRVAQRRHLAKVVQGIERRFPQICLRVVTCGLGRDQSVQSYGFWLMNRGEFVDMPEAAHEQGLVLLVIDAQSCEACLHFGYLLDSGVDERESFEALRKAHPYLIESNYYEASKVMLVGVEKYLKRLYKRAKRRAKEV
ncbi:hypothetical protein [Rubritalea marina]|uniref:hypothetical protein n=1 Tax=Rubritalea marina TaxID=361055 RepID=UPI001969D8C8|nr:hypothetical protein [Rubritalea marina]